MLNVDVGLAFTRSGYDWSMQSAVGGCSSILSAMVRVWTSRFWRRAGIRTGSEVVRKVFFVCHGGSFTRHPKTSCAIQTISVACMYQIVPVSASRVEFLPFPRNLLFVSVRPSLPILHSLRGDPHTTHTPYHLTKASCAYRLRLHLLLLSSSPFNRV